MLTVHHLWRSQSERIVWLCEELEIEYELKRYERRPDNRLAPDEYKALHPSGTAPVITDGDLVLGESGAICEYICVRHGSGRLRPGPADANFADHLIWFHWSNATFMSALLAQLAVANAGPNAVMSPFFAGRVRRCWEMVEQRLQEAPFFAGPELTTADIMMGFALTTGRTFWGTSIDGYPNVRAYLARIGERPAYQRAMAKAEPGMTPALT